MRRANSERLKPRARNIRKFPSDAERLLWLNLRNNQLEGLKFRRQLTIGEYIADFACVSLRLVVEIDGDQHSEAEAYDAKRTADLNALGWRGIRFSSRDVLRDVNAVFATILTHARPSP